MTTITKERNTQTSITVDWSPVPADRCDRCGDSSRAYTKVIKDDAYLLLCGHHTHQYEAQLIADGWNIYSRLDVLEAEEARYKAVSGV